MAYEKGSRPEGGFKRRGPVYFRERKNPSEKNHRKLCKASESSYSSNQESKTHCTDAVRSGLIENNKRLSHIAAVFF